jgi:hypothetical protein
MGRAPGIVLSRTCLPANNLVEPVVTQLLWFLISRLPKPSIEGRGDVCCWLNVLIPLEKESSL